MRWLTDQATFISLCIKEYEQRLESVMAYQTAVPVYLGFMDSRVHSLLTDEIQLFVDLSFSYKRVQFLIGITSLFKYIYWETYQGREHK